MDNNAIEINLNYSFNQEKGIYLLGNKTLQIQMGHEWLKEFIGVADDGT